MGVSFSTKISHIRSTSKLSFGTPLSTLKTTEQNLSLLGSPRFETLNVHKHQLQRYVVYSWKMQTYYRRNNPLFTFAANIVVGCRSSRRDLHLHAECVFLFTNKFIGRREAFSCIRRMGLIWNPLSSGLYPECCQPSCCIQLTVEAAAAAKEESVGE